MRYQTRSIFRRLRERKRLVAYLLSFVIVVAVQTLLYWWGMRALEGEPRPLLDSFNVVIQSLTTTGYGQDAPWGDPLVSLLVIVMQFTGVAYLFVAFPLFIVPWIRTVVAEPRIPRALTDADDHVIICRYSPMCATVVEDLEVHDQAYVIIESDEERVEELYEADRQVVVGDPTDPETLEGVQVRAAKAVVIDVRETGGIDTVLAIRDVDDAVDIVCLTDDAEQGRYLRYAGATTVLSPSAELGKALADKAQNYINVDDKVIDRPDVDLAIAEFPIDQKSSLHGQGIDDIDEFDAVDVTLVGAWIRGEFVTDPDRQRFVDENTSLVVAGTEAQLDRLEGVLDTAATFPTAGPVIVAGYGLVGRSATEVLREAGHDVTVIDTEAADGVDIVGDATVEAAFEEAAIADAGAVILALPDDETTMEATLVARQADPDVEIVAAAAELATTSKLYRAGADYVLALPKIAGQMTIGEVFDRDLLSLQERITVTALDAASLDGHSLDDIRGDGSIVAVLRDDGIVDTRVTDVELKDDDRIVVAGPAGTLETIGMEDG